MLQAESRKSFGAAESHDRNGQSLSLRASKKGAEARLPQAALGTSPNFLVPGEGGVRRRKILGPWNGLQLRADTGQGQSPCWVRSWNIYTPPASELQALHLQEALPACSSLLLLSSLGRNSTQGLPPKGMLGRRATKTDEVGPQRAATKLDGSPDHQAGPGREDTGNAHTHRHTSPLEEGGKKILAKVPPKSAP